MDLTESLGNLGIESQDVTLFFFPWTKRIPDTTGAATVVRKFRETRCPRTRALPKNSDTRFIECGVFCSSILLPAIRISMRAEVREPLAF